MFTLQELERRLKESEATRDMHKRKLNAAKVRISRYKKAIQNLNQLELFESEENAD